MQHAARSIPGELHDEQVTSTEVLIIGFGFSAIPLIRELERDDIDYVVVSDGESIWDRLERHGRLDFDLVSSMHTSLYSFELVNREVEDRYLTSREYSSFIKKYMRRYGSNVVKDRVTLVENHPLHSIVRTQSGRTFAATHLVISTAFKRRMNQLLNEFDYTCAKQKTIAIAAMGDSVNLMISKLIPYNNRIILITNGFFLLDKLSFYDEIPYTLDQLEYHNMRYVSKMLYRRTIGFGPYHLTSEPPRHQTSLQRLLKFLSMENFYLKHPLAIRSFKADLKRFMWQSPLPNGVIAIKYWPIDSYQKLFDNESLEQSIKDGYLLNDIVYFVEQALVELWPKRETVIDRGAKTIRWQDKVIEYDELIEQDYESPNLPEIELNHAGSPRRKYEYVCRDNFMGVVPKDLSNVYFIGYIRPTTGGLNNIAEMQCLFVHKMITDPEFHDEIYAGIENRIQKYNRHYRLSDETSHTDHLVHYGFYTEDIAQLLKINLHLSDCRSLRDLGMYFFFPNCAFKYRQSGRYQVEGVRQMVEQIYENHNGFSVVRNYVLGYALLQFTAYVAVLVAYFNQPFHIPAAALPFLLGAVLLNPITALVAVHGFGRNFYVNLVLVAGLALTAFYPSTWVPVVSLLAACVLTYLFRRLGSTRVPFNDTKNKKSPKNREFFKRYCETFKAAFAERSPAQRPGSFPHVGALSTARMS